MPAVRRPGYHLIDHPADLGIEAFGRNLIEAFEQAGLGLMSVILDVDSVKLKESRRLLLEASDLEHLLVKWLTEILYLYDGESFAGGRFQISELSPQHLSATVTGDSFSEKNHTTRLDVKAITYHQLSVEQNDEGGRVRVFLDI
jgi:SHS2 domain-containing protein